MNELFHIYFTSFHSSREIYTFLSLSESSISCCWNIFKIDYNEVLLDKCCFKSLQLFLYSHLEVRCWQPWVNMHFRWLPRIYGTSYHCNYALLNLWKLSRIQLRLFFSGNLFNSGQGTIIIFELVDIFNI